MKVILNFITLISLLLFTNFQCDENPCDPVINEATISVNLTPEQIEYAVGDTILVSTGFGTVMPLTNISDSISVENGIGYFDLLIMSLGLLPDSLRGFSDFDIININGDLNQDYISDSIITRYRGQINFNCNADTCKFEFGLVPKVRGNYCLALDFGKIVLQDSTHCPPRVALYNNVFNVSSYHREIYQEMGIHSDIKLPGMYSDNHINVLENDGAYAFRVK